ncbi:hypothetical protein FJ444_10945 [Aestuariibacter sp. GS-14]|uniref:right-handed parallel beta-helix repeat-containing protein n=1 Tax=Aestuariibacter sp. GS-14 TaxID=2590670 RepID=UPI00112C2681|nr:DUF4990 domain-containing protein [Aestuariibacter sp. GS-14]TPV58537.1 hypothetical protein FJ444_10945 [Aestuariibacter sp. GS-14]
MKKTLLSFTTLCVLSSVSLLAEAADYYVSPTGNDSNSGSIDSPLETLMRAQDLADAGDTVYIRGGTYYLDNDDISRTDSSRAYVNEIKENGIRYIAYNGETPIFDFTGVKPVDRRVVAFLVSGDDNTFEGFHITGVQITIDYKRTQSTAIRVVNGDRNLFERLEIYDNMAIGWYLASGSDNQVINVDAYRNKGLNNYSHGNIDGFGVHPDSASSGNILKGCRAWFNSDDGFDLISAGTAVTIENSWAFYNGFDTDFTKLGDGNGFKLGGYGRDGKVDYPVPVPRHAIYKSLAVGNKASGFYANHHIDGQDWVSNTAIRNYNNYNLLSTLADNATDVPGYAHYMRNNLGFGASNEVVNLGPSSENDLANNYFDLDVTVSEDDFISLDESQLTQQRQPNGDLPDITFAKLAPGSDLINAGADTGLSYNGAAPDLGAFETAPSAPQGLSAIPANAEIHLSWLHSNEPYFSGYSVYRSTDPQGVYTVLAQHITTTSYSDTNVINGVTYFYKVSTSVENGQTSALTDYVEATPESPVPDTAKVASIEISIIDQHASRGAESDNAINQNGKHFSLMAMKRFGKAVVTITDNFGTPIANAVVSGRFSGTFNEKQSVTTDEYGIATFISKKFSTSDVTFGFKVVSISSDLTDGSSASNTKCDVF